MLNGITWKGKHSLADFDATMISRDTNPPQKDRITDRPPYSSVTYDFTELFGEPSYPERTLQYQFMISDERGICYLKKRVNLFRKWLYGETGKSALYDDREDNYHFNAVCTGFSEKYTSGVIAEITVIFQADPFMLPNVPAEQYAIPVSDCRFPDLDEDERVTAHEAALIQTAAANIGAQLPSGLTEEQEFLADVDRDGKITAKDSAIVLEFASLCGTHIYSNDAEGWTKYINYKLNRLPEVI